MTDPIVLVKDERAKPILTIAPYTFLPASSGGQRAIYFFYQHLGKKLPLHVISTDKNVIDRTGEPLHFKTLPLLGHHIFRYFNPGIYFKIRSLIKSNRIDTLLIEHPYMSWMGWLLKITTGVRLIIRSHNIEALRFKALGKWWWRMLADYERWAHRKASHSFFITREDAEYAIATYGIKPEKTSVITYGLQGGETPTPDRKRFLAERFKQVHGIPTGKTTLLFNGIFGYRPNDEALELLLEKIYPALLRQSPDFHLIICGAKIPARYVNRKEDNLTIMGFVPDIKAVFQAADIFLNPIWLGGGIKTKLVEALAEGAAAVSFSSGAIGINPKLLDGKLKVVPDKDIKAFVQAIIEVRSYMNTPVPAAFLKHFSWDHIAGKAADILRPQ